MKTAIFGTAFNFPTKDVLPFLKSLEATGYSGDLILLGNRKTNIESGNYGYRLQVLTLDDLKVLLHRVQRFFLLKTKSAEGYWQFRRSYFEEYGHSFQVNGELPAKFRRFLLGHYYLATTRFIFYYEYLLKNKYDKVFFTDVSDVIFQKNIFNSGLENGVYAFAEDRSGKVGHESYNANWVREGFGDKVLQQIRDEQIFCSGTIYSDYHSALQFLADYFKIISTTNMLGEIVGLDQGIFNYMIHHQKFSYFKKEENGKTVFTLALVPQKNISVRDGSIQPTDGNEVPAIVHQYTRFPSLQKIVQEKYS